jgi:hypothetical protein
VKDPRNDFISSTVQSHSERQKLAKLSIITTQNKKDYYTSRRYKDL